MFKRILHKLFMRYQLMLLEPQGGKTVRNMQVNLAGLLALILIISLASAALVWHFLPARSETLNARFYQLQQQNHSMQNTIATLKADAALSKEQNDGLKHALLTGRQDREALQKRLNVYASILEARKSAGVRILRATARMQDKSTLSYSLVLVKGGNYPRHVSGSVRIIAFGSHGEKQLLQLGKKNAELPYKMDTHIFLEGSIPWSADWQPVRLQVTRLNYQGAERDKVEIKLNANAKTDKHMVKLNLSNQGNMKTDTSNLKKSTQPAVPALKESK